LTRYEGACVHEGQLHALAEVNFLIVTKKIINCFKSIHILVHQWWKFRSFHSEFEKWSFAIWVFLEYKTFTCTWYCKRNGILTWRGIFSQGFNFKGKCDWNTWSFLFHFNPNEKLGNLSKGLNLGSRLTCYSVFSNWCH